MLSLKIFLQVSAVASSFACCYALSSFAVDKLNERPGFEYFLVNATVDEQTTSQDEEGLFGRDKKTIHAN